MSKPDATTGLLSDDLLLDRLGSRAAPSDERVEALLAALARHADTPLPGPRRRRGLRRRTITALTVVVVGGTGVGAAAASDLPTPLAGVLGVHRIWSTDRDDRATRSQTGPANQAGSAPRPSEENPASRTAWALDATSSMSSAASVWSLAPVAAVAPVRVSHPVPERPSVTAPPALKADHRSEGGSRPSTAGDERPLQQQGAGRDDSPAREPAQPLRPDAPPRPHPDEAPRPRPDRHPAPSPVLPPVLPPNGPDRPGSAPTPRPTPSRPPVPTPSRPHHDATPPPQRPPTYPPAFDESPIAPGEPAGDDGAGPEGPQPQGAGAHPGHGAAGRDRGGRPTWP